MPVLNTQISTTADDGDEQNSNSSWYQNGRWGNIMVGFDGVATYASNGGFRFQNISVPPGATVTDARVEVYRNSSGGSGTQAQAIIYCVATDNAQVWSSTNRPSTTVKTAGITWNPPASGTWNTSPNLSSIVQSVISRPGWTSGNALAFSWIYVNTGGYGHWSDYYDFNTDPTRAAKLTITYETGGGSTFYSVTSGSFPSPHGQTSSAGRFLSKPSGAFPPASGTAGKKTSKTLSGGFPAGSGFASKRTSKLLGGDLPEPLAQLLKTVRARLAGDMPAGSGGLSLGTSIKQLAAGVFGGISGAVSGLLRTAGVSTGRAVKIIGSSFQRFFQG